MKRCLKICVLIAASACLSGLSQAGVPLQNIVNPGFNAALAIVPGGASPVAAFDPVNNRYMLVFQQVDLPLLDKNIYGQFISANGIPLGVSFPISTIIGLQDRPDVSYDTANGRFLVTWEDARAGILNFDIYGQLLNANGTLFGGEIAISIALNDQFRPVLAWDWRSGRFLVAWEDWRAGTLAESIFAQLINANGALFGAEIAISAPANRAQFPSLDNDPVNGRFLLAWSEWNGTDIDVAGQLLNADGSPFGTRIAISTQASLQLMPSVGHNPVNGGFSVVWQDNRPGPFTHDIYGQALNANGSLAGAEIAVSTAANDEWNPETLMNAATGQYLVAWEEWNGIDSDILARHVPGGQVIISATANDEFTPRLAYNSVCGNILTVFEDITLGNIGLTVDGPCNPVTPVTATLGLNASLFATGSQIALSAMLTPGPAPIVADVFLRVHPPTGKPVYLQQGGNIALTPAPYTTNWIMTAFNAVLFNHTFTASNPPGNYVIEGFFTMPGTMHIIGPLPLLTTSFTLL